MSYIRNRPVRSFLKSICKGGIYTRKVVLIIYNSEKLAATMVSAPEKLLENDGTPVRPVSNLASTPSFQFKVR